MQAPLAKAKTKRKQPVSFDLAMDIMDSVDTKRKDRDVLKTSLTTNMFWKF